MRLFREYIVIFVLAILYCQMSGQKDNLVRDEKLYNDLYNFIVPRLHVLIEDSNGKKVPTTEQYKKGIGITSKNLRSDTILIDKSIVGLYATRIACWDCGSDDELYFQYKNKREFIDIDDKNLNPFKLINSIELFFKANPNEFSEIEKIRILKGAIESLESRIIHPFDDW